MAKRPRFSRWRRLPGVFRTGENRPIDSGTELDRIILYVPARILDLAEALAEKAGVASVQDYCALLLMQALENERVKKRVAEFEARRGPLEGLKQIADDPHYLVEWQERSENRAETPYEYAADDGQGKARASAPESGEPGTADVVMPDQGARALDAPSEPPGDHTKGALGPRIAVEPAIANAPAASSKPMVLLMSDSSPQETLARHVGHGTDDYGFLPCLRRGEQVPAGKVAELNRALSQLEEELGAAAAIERRTAHMLHRLALESQVLLTDAWPGAFDEPVIAAIRGVQEAVERILSGQDIRYYPHTETPRPERPT